MGSSSSIGDVTARLTLDTASFDSKLETSNQGLDRHASLTEKASARARAAWEKELIAQDKAQQALDAVSRSRQLAALKTDILSRSVEAGASAQSHAGETAVTSMQATAASLRAMEGGFNNNLRSMERWVSQSTIVSNAAKSMFQFVGAGTFGFLIAGMAEEVAKFVERIEKMPKAIEQGFGSLNLASRSSTDSLRLANDELQNSVNRLQHVPENNVKIAMDEARVAADKLATSVENTNRKLVEMLSGDHLSGWALLLGKVGTADREGTVKAYGDQSNSDAYELATAQASGDPKRVANARKRMGDTQNSELANMQADLTRRQSIAKNPGSPDDSANINIDKGVSTEIMNRQALTAEESRNAELEAKKKKLEADKAASAAALEARKKANEEAVKAEQTAYQNWAAVQTRTYTEDVAYWAQRVAATTTGSAAFIEARKQQWKAITEMNKQDSETLQKFNKEYMAQFNETSGLSKDDTKSIDIKGKDSADRIQNWAKGLELTQLNNAAMAEYALRLDVAAGKVTRLDAARQLAAIHQQEYERDLEKLQNQASYISTDKQYDKRPEGRDAALADNTNRTNTLKSQYAIQSAQDKQAMDPASSSGLVGFSDALNEFVIQSRNAAERLKELSDSILNGINQQVSGAIVGQKTNFSQFGTGVARNVATMGLQKAEGSVLGLFGFGGSKKKPTGAPGDAIHTIVDNQGGGGAASSVVGAATKAIAGGSSGGGVGGFFGGLLKSFLPHFAEGGPISADTWAVVGERGPELFHSGGGGHIVPNNKVSPMSGGGGDTHVQYSIDARGTDPVQTEQRVRSAIVAAHQSAVKQSVQQVQQQQLRKPVRSR